jgi:hypothetical protein
VISNKRHAQRAYSQPLGFVLWVDHLSSEELNNNKYYQYMRKTGKKQESLFYKIYILPFTVTKLYERYRKYINSFIHSQPLGFVSWVDHLSSEEPNNIKYYQYMRKTEKPRNYYLILYVLPFTLTKLYERY